jgi:hypothetical protein
MERFGMQYIIKYLAQFKNQLFCRVPRESEKHVGVVVAQLTQLIGEFLNAYNGQPLAHQQEITLSLSLSATDTETHTLGNDMMMNTRRCSAIWDWEQLSRSHSSVPLPYLLQYSICLLRV